LRRAGSTARRPPPPRARRRPAHFARACNAHKQCRGEFDAYSTRKPPPFMHFIISAIINGTQQTKPRYFGRVLCLQQARLRRRTCRRPAPGDSKRFRAFSDIATEKQHAEKTNNKRNQRDELKVRKSDTFNACAGGGGGDGGIAIECRKRRRRRQA